MGMTFSEENGVFKIWDTDAINEYNTEGITLQVVDFELDVAKSGLFIPPSKLFPETITEKMRQQFSGKKAVAEAEIPLIVFQAPDVMTQVGFENVVPFVPVLPKNLTPDRKPLCAKDLILPGDDERAAYISMNNEALCSSPEHQYAISRWLLAKQSEHGDKETRAKAANLIEKAMPPKKGAPKRFQYHEQGLAMVYNHLMKYGRGLRECIRKVDSVEELLNFFPDCMTLESKGLRIIVGDAVKNKQVLPPAPSDIAEEYIKARTGMKHSRLHEFIKTAKKASASPKASKQQPAKNTRSSRKKK